MDGSPEKHRTCTGTGCRRQHKDLNNNKNRTKVGRGWNRKAIAGPQNGFAAETQKKTPSVQEFLSPSVKEGEGKKEEGCC